MPVEGASWNLAPNSKVVEQQPRARYKSPSSRTHRELVLNKKVINDVLERDNETFHGKRHPDVPKEVLGL